MHISSTHEGEATPGWARTDERRGGEAKRREKTRGGEQTNEETMSPDSLGMLRP